MNIECEEFKMEVSELLDQAEKALLSFDQLPANQSSQSLYDEVFRAYHNIKGTAGMMEWEELQHHVHQLENILMQSKDTASIPKHLIGWFLKGNDAARAIIAGEKLEFNYQTDSSSPVSKTEKSDSLPEEFYTEVNEGLERISATLMKIEEHSGDKGIFDSLYRDIHSIKGAVQLFGFVEASSLSHTIENSLEGLREKEAFELDKGFINILLLSIDLVGFAVKNPNNQETQQEVERMISMLSSFDEVTETKEAPPELKLVTPTAVVSAPVEADKGESTIRVQVSLLDRLMTLMGEMVLVRNQVLQYSSNTDDLEFLNLSQKLDVVTSELQEETMKTRMQPIGNILTKFQRMVRDLSGSLGKNINLNLHGIETELDKTLIEAVKDPLTHIVRNACDHGIENPQDRLDHHKPEFGTITIKAYHEGGQVIVDITDDGKGLSRDKLLKKAIEKGIVDSAKAERMSDREVHALIFAPGFSTAEKVTNVSGRGVGMDVVKSNIERIGGLVDISSNEGEGTRITIKIPLTLAIVPAMIIRCEEDRFAIPQVKLVELVRVDPNAIEYVQGQPIYRLRGNILPLLNLKTVLGVQNIKDQIEAINIVVLNSEGQLFGMMVDEILDTADIVVKPLARFLKTIPIYSGATVLGDGKVAFILDVLGIAHEHLGTSEDSLSKNLGSKYSDLINDELTAREFVLVKLSAQAKYAIPLDVVSRMEEIKTSTIEISGQQRVIRYRDGILKIINLNEVLGHASPEEKEITQIIVVKIEEQLLGLEVNQIIDILSTTDILDSSLSTHEAISGNLITLNEIIVVLDVERVHELTQPKKVMRTVQTPGNRILLVEDTDSIRHHITRELEELEYEVIAAVDGMDGLRKIAEHKFSFDLIISDIEMPRMNGFEFAKKVRTIQQLKGVPLIAFTTKNSKADLMEAKVAGFTTYLEKGKSKLLPLLIKECMTDHKRKAA